MEINMQYVSPKIGGLPLFGTLNPTQKLRKLLHMNSLLLRMLAVPVNLSATTKCTISIM